jgi:hypothetical protein
MKYAPPRFRLLPRKLAVTGSALTGVLVEPEQQRLRAIWSALLQLPQRPQVLNLRYSEGWEIESVVGEQGPLSFAKTGDRELRVWVEPSDFVAGEPLRVKILATREFLEDNSSTRAFIGDWVVHIDDSRLDEAAYLLPPTDREVQVDGQGRRRQVASLEDLEIAAELAGEVPESALRFSGPGGPPSLELRRRQAELDVEILTRVSVASPKTLRWQARAKCLPRGGQVDEIRVRVYGSVAQQGMAFRMEGTVGESPLSVASTPILGDGFTDWSLRLGAPKSTEFFVTATLNDWIADGPLPLLTVPRATKHRGEIELLDGVRLKGSPPYPSLLPVNPQRKKSSVIGYGPDGSLKVEVAVARLSESQRSNESTTGSSTGSQREQGGSVDLESRGTAESFVLWSWTNHHVLHGDGGIRIELSGAFSGTGILEIPLPAGFRFIPPERGPRSPANVLDPDRLTLRLDDSSTDTFAVTLAGRLLSNAHIHSFRPIHILPRAPIVSQQVTVSTRADAWIVPLTCLGSSDFLYVRSSVAIVAVFTLATSLLALSLWPVRSWGLALVAVAAWSSAFCGFLAESPVREIAFLLAFACAVGPLVSSLRSHYRFRVQRLARPLSTHPPTRARDLRSDSLSYLLLFVALSAITFSTLAADPKRGNEIHEVLIPIDDEGDVHGTMVFIPRELYARVRGTSVIKSRAPALPRILASDYQVSLSRSNDPAVAAQSRIEATWQIDVDVSEQPIFLPIDPRTIDTLQWSATSSSRTWRDGIRDGVSGVVLLPPSNGALKLQGKLIPTLNQLGDWVTWSLPIPPSHHSRLNVTYDPAPGVPDTIQSAGQQVHDPQTRQVRVELGGQIRLSLRKRIAAATPMVIDQRIEPRWWIRAGVDCWSAELEYDRPLTNTGTIVTIEYPLHPVSTNPQWRLLKTESLDGGRHRLHFEPGTAAPGPLRLLWSIPFAGGADAASLPNANNVSTKGKPVLLNLPVVRADDGLIPQRTLLGIEATNERTEVIPDAADVEKLPIEAFTTWKGFRSNLGSVYRVDANPVPPLSYKQTFSEREIAEIQHRLVISPRGDHSVSSQFRAATGQMPLLFEIPQHVWIDRVELDGDVVEQGITVVDGRNLLMLAPRSNALEHRVTLAGRVNRRVDFVPPRIRISDFPIRQETYEILKPPHAMVKVSQTESLEILGRQGEPLTDLLESVLCWRVNDINVPRLSIPSEGTAGVSPQILASSQMVTIVRRAEGNWQQETIYRISEEECPSELLSILIPQAWSERVEVNVPLWLLERPEQGYRRLNVLIPRRNSTTSSSNTNPPFAIRVQSTYAGEARVEAPLLRLDGYRVAEHRLVLPGRLTTQSIQWQPIGMRRIAPLGMEGIADLPPEPWILEPEGEGVNLAARLVPLDGMQQQVARSTMRESWLFHSQTGRRHLMAAWDFIPGSLTQVSVEVPEGLVPLSAKSAGVPARQVWEQGRRTLTLDLNLHQLGQVIEVLFAVEPTWRNQLPELFSYPADRSILNLLSDEPQPMWEPSSTQGWQKERFHDQQREDSAREVIRSAFDVLPNRPRGEADDWLVAWLSRFGKGGDDLGKLGPLRERLPPEASAALASWDPATLSSAMQAKTPTFLRDGRWQTLGTFSALGQPRTIPLLRRPATAWSTALAWAWLVVGGLAVYLLGYWLSQRRPIWFSVFPLACVGIMLTSIAFYLGGIVCLLAFAFGWWRRSWMDVA